MLAIPLIAGTAAVAEDLMVFVAGEAFAPSGRFLTILMIAGGAVFWGALFGHAVVAIGLQRKMIWAYAVDAALSLGLYLYLIPRIGAVGAAWVTVFSEAFIAVVTAAAVARATKAFPSLAVFWRSIAAAAAMAALLAILSPLHVLVRILLGAASYFLVLAAIGGIGRDVIALLRPRPPQSA
jgi:O-antigen/teichoic acid export membrane protein